MEFFLSSHSLSLFMHTLSHNLEHTTNLSLFSVCILHFVPLTLSFMPTHTHPHTPSPSLHSLYIFPPLAAKLSTHSPCEGNNFVGRVNTVKTWLKNCCDQEPIMFWKLSFESIFNQLNLSLLITDRQVSLHDRQLIVLLDSKQSLVKAAGKEQD